MKTNLVRFDCEVAYIAYKVTADFINVDQEQHSAFAMADRIRAILNEIYMSLNLSKTQHDVVAATIALEAFYYMDANV